MDIELIKTLIKSDILEETYEYIKFKTLFYEDGYFQIKKYDDNIQLLVERMAERMDKSYVFDFEEDLEWYNNNVKNWLNQRLAEYRNDRINEILD